MSLTPTEAAERCRLDAGLSLDEPIKDLVEFAEAKLGCLVYVVDLPGGTIEGACVPVGDETLIFLAKRARDGRPFHPVRQRFTLAHEIGHQQLGHGLTLDAKVSAELAAHTDEERDANEFASALLMPIAAIEHWLAAAGLRSIDDVDAFARFAGHFGVSSPAAFYRISNEGLIGDRRASDRLRAAVSSSEATERRRFLRALEFNDTLQQVHGDDGYRFPPQFIRQAQELFGEQLLSDGEYRVYTDGHPGSGR